MNVYVNYVGTPLHQAVICAVETPQKGKKSAGTDVDQIRELIKAGADLTVADKEGFTPLGLAIEYKRKTAEQVLREAGAPEKKPRASQSKAKTKPLDLRKDFQTVYQYLSDRVRDFNPAKHKDLGRGKKVKMIHLGFEYAQQGWVAVVFDTRPDAEPDGEWTSKIDNFALEMPHWTEACETNMEQAIAIVSPDGLKSELPANTELADTIGEMLKDVLLAAREKDLFANLPKDTDCTFSIEHFDGGYGWLASEERGEENLA